MESILLNIYVWKKTIVQEQQFQHQWNNGGAEDMIYTWGSFCPTINFTGWRETMPLSIFLSTERWIITEDWRTNI